MKFGEGPVALWAWPAVILAVALAILLADPGGLARHIRNIEFDAYQYSKPRTYEDTAVKSGLSVRVLEADAASVEKFGAWPWPRATLAKLVGELKDGGAALVVFALPLDHPDPASPKAMLDYVPAGPSTDAVRATLAKLRSPDDVLAKAMAETH